ncbi:MAG: cytochrome P450 [Acidimicrobiales bacterium]
MSTSDELFYNPLADGYVADPFPHLADLRGHEPVHQTLMGPWALFRHADVFRLLRDPQLSVDDRNADIAGSPRAEIFDRIAAEEGAGDRRNSSILNTDPPDHTRLRSLLGKAFTPRTIGALRPMVQGLVDAALDRMAAADGPVDVIDELAFPLPFDVISEMLGMPETDKLQIRDWSEALVKTLDAVLTEDDVRAAIRADRAMDAYIDGVIAWKRANPADDLLTLLIDTEHEGDRLTPDELRDQVALLFVAGHETTVNLIGTGILELLRHPDQARRWRDDPELAGPAVEELLRFVAPVQFSRRIATADVTFGDGTIPKGSFVLACLASANRDPEVFGPTADELDLGRADAGQHLSFGSGTHYCLGASLAKLEAQVAIGTFLQRFPDARLAGEPAWNGRTNLRGVAVLPVEVR